MNRDLVEGAIAGDREAYTELVRQSIDRSYALAGLILRDPDRARDATQEAYVTAWRSLSLAAGPGRFDAWLRRLVVRACYQAVRGASDGIATSTSPRSTWAGRLRAAVADSTIDLATRDQLERGFRRLKPDQRAVLVLRHYLDLTIEETADAMGVPVGTAKSRLHRATSAMRAVLEADARDLSARGRTGGMTATHDVDRLLATWFAADAAETAPAGLVEAIARSRDDAAPARLALARPLAAGAPATPDGRPPGRAGRPAARGRGRLAHRGGLPTPRATAVRAGPARPVRDEHRWRHRDDGPRTAGRSMP